LEFTELRRKLIAPAREHTPNEILIEQTAARKIPLDFRANESVHAALT
jgi:hypothetical protein